MGLYTNLIQTKVFSKFAGSLIGEDEFGNKYYQEKLLFGKPQRVQKRWVIYKSGAVEASAVPAKWFSWLHYTSERALCGEPHSWEKPHRHNQTGGNESHHPATSLLNETSTKRPETAHEAWAPKEKKAKN